ncbi:hypothetical protein [Bradyrhizobium sp. HKCCYLRH3061]|uniref:hypothetical protein n=1 Tax=Bradyrhizobium sp. HKCCYLRH3061 TaxID=3420734 RepID=UPI003EBC3A56
MKSWSGLAIGSLAAPVIGIVLLAVFINKSAIALDYRSPAFTAGVNVASGLFVIALFMERSLAVLNNLLFSEEQRIADAAVMGAETEAAFVDAAKLLTVVTTAKERVRLAVGFVFGLLISAAGPRTLEGLLTLDLTKMSANDASKLTEPHLMLFYGVDIILTAGLLAGGSNAINEVIEILRNKAKALYWQVVRDLRENSPKG